jgi:hypothetical protein
MSSNGKTNRMFWLTPVCCAAAGVVFLASSWLGGHPGLGVSSFAIMVVFSAVLVLTGRRSETVRGLLDQRDERLSAIDVRATAASGLVLILVVIGAAVVELARGHSGAPYTWLGAMAGLTYLVAIVVQRIKG